MSIIKLVNEVKKYGGLPHVQISSNGRGVRISILLVQAGAGMHYEATEETELQATIAVMAKLVGNG